MKQNLQELNLLLEELILLKNEGTNEDKLFQTCTLVKHIIELSGVPYLDVMRETMCMMKDMERDWKLSKDRKTL
jgi:hypothetical protein